jgi:hypothetical protein
MPGRSDHEPVIETLFRHRGESERWQQLQRHRTQSFALLLEFHAERPDHHRGIGGWRRSLISGQLGDKTWRTTFPKHREAWRAYQYRETLVATLTALFSSSLIVLNRLGSASPVQLATDMTESIEWPKLGVAPDDPFRRLVDASRKLCETPAELVETTETAFEQFGSATVNQMLTTAAQLTGAMADLPDGDDDFQHLLDRGGHERLSVAYMSQWLNERAQQTCAEVLGQLIVFLFHRHLSVATTKLSPTDTRDPFCVAAQEDGTYKVIRDDEPFWTGARFETLNHLLWTAGVLNDPGQDARPTELGHKLLEEVRAGG